MKSRSFHIIACVFFTILLLQSCKPVEQELQIKVETGTVGDVGYDFALVSGKAVDVGEGGLEQHGFCFGTTENPTIISSNTQLGSLAEAGDFSDSLLNLQSGTKYYVRAYALASDEIFYGDQTSFTTLITTSPVVAIETVGEYKNDSVEVSSTVTDDGGSEVTARGVCWSLGEAPLVSGDHTTDGSGTGSFTSIISGLLPDTVYYIRAYASSAVATSYSGQHQVSTPAGNFSVITSDITGITMTGAVGGGTIVSDGGPDITARGVCWSTDPDPDISGNHTTDGSGTGTFTSSLTGLSSATTYYVRAYATRASGTSYGNQVSFTTTSQSASLPEVTTNAVTSITENSAVSGGNITDDGGSAITARGVCWSTSHAPDLSDGFTEDGTGTGSYTSALTELSSNTTYYVRAYATNGEGTEYGEEVSFTTDQPLYRPTLTTASVSSITETSAISGGNITDDGGAEVTARGVCWNTSGNPEVTDDHTTDGTGTGTFTSSITGLDPSTTYYVKAYATNEEGTAYGNEVSFTTGASSGYPMLTTSPATSITESSAVSGGDITDNGGSAIIARGVCWSTTTGPDLNGDYTTDGTGTGSFTSSITGLDPNTTYYVKAYATNGLGTAFGNEISFTTGSSPTSPTLTTTPVHSLTAKTAKSGGNISDDGGSLVIARGVCWNTSGSPDLTDDYTTDGGGTGEFTSTIQDLVPNTFYYVRAYATNSSGTEFGNEVTFTSLDVVTVSDYDGNTYVAVEIGTQTWLAENLKVTHYNNGDAIPQVTDQLDWVATDAGAFCYFDNDIATNGEVYGALYNFLAVEDSRGLCPSGWHVASSEEWDTLLEFAGGYDVAGARLRDASGEYWYAGYSTDEYGFRALPGGYRNSSTGVFYDLTKEGKWWTSHYVPDGAARIRFIEWLNNRLQGNQTGVKAGCSVRCVKD